MSVRDVRLRPAARRDVAIAARWYGENAGEAVALRFVEAVRIMGLAHVGDHPASGSTRHGVASGIPEMRSWLLRGFPYLIFYHDHGQWLDVWRVLHASRDLPAWLATEDD